MQTLLDDAGSSSIQGVGTVDAPFTGTYTPNQPLSTFNGENANGTWQLQAQDFYLDDTGNVRAFSLIVTPAICDAPAASPPTSTAPKTVSGSTSVGGTVTYTVTLTNSGGGTQSDNAGDEFTDVLPAGLTLVSATASSGTAVASVGTNTVTWNGALGPVNGSVTITITATINAAAPGTVISNQGSISYDSDGNNTNDATRLTDDPAVAGTSNPTTFAITGAAVTATKTASGTYASGSTLTYTIVLSNSGNAAAGDNAGDELTDVLPASLTLVSATATSGTAVANTGTNTVTWNGAIPAGGLRDGDHHRHHQLQSSRHHHQQPGDDLVRRER